MESDAELQSFGKSEASEVSSEAGRVLARAAPGHCGEKSCPATSTGRPRRILRPTREPRPLSQTRWATPPSLQRRPEHNRVAMHSSTGGDVITSSHLGSSTTSALNPRAGARPGAPTRPPPKNTAHTGRGTPPGRTRPQDEILPPGPTPCENATRLARPTPRGGQSPTTPWPPRRSATRHPRHRATLADHLFVFAVFGRSASGL